jgi:MFS family permease
MSQAVESIATHVGEQAYPSRAVAWYATIVLAFLYWLSILDRFIISLLVGPIQRDLGLTDVQFGLLHGFAFALTFAIFGLVAGVLADRVSRRWVIFVGVSIWSLATAACGLARNFWHLMLARVGVGAGEATLNPCATSMLTDLFPRERLTAGMAVYAMGATVGMGTALMFGGWIVEVVSATGMMTLPIIGTVPSWQAVFFIVGVPGALFSLLVFTLPEPARRGQRVTSPAGRPRQSYRDLLRFIQTRRRFFICHYAGFTLASAIISGGGGWYAVHLTRAFGWSPGQIGMALGLTIAGAGVIGKIICGNAVDAMYRRGLRDAQLRWYAAVLVIATPIGIIASTSGNPWVFVFGLGGFLMLVSPMAACANAAMNLVTPNELRGAGVALFGAVGGILGGGAGPVLIAAAAEHLYSGPASIGYGMATMVAICCPLAALCLALGFRAMREAMVEAERWEKA